MQLDLLKQSYAGKKVFVTGHTGFKGSWLLCMLHLLGAEIKGYALAPSDPQDLYHKIDGDGLCTSVIADIRDKERLAEEIASAAPDFIFHLAAQPLVIRSYKQPVETFDVNIMGTVNLLESVRALKKRVSVVVITTDKVYENKESAEPFVETNPLGGHDPYSASKACAEIVTDSYRKSFFAATTEGEIGLATARAGNVVGGGDWAENRIIPDIIRALRSDTDIMVRNPHSTRPWQHVVEPLTGYLVLGSNLYRSPAMFSQAYNFGPATGDAVTVEKLVQEAIRLWGKGGYVASGNPNAPHEAGLLTLDISKAANDLGWKPAMDSMEVLQYTIDWYRQCADQATARLFTLQQVQKYWSALS